MQRERLLLITLALIQFTNIMDFMIIMPLGAQLMDIFRITPQQFGFIVSAYTLSAGICVFLASFFIDRLDRKTALLIAYGGFIAGTFACAFAGSYFLLLSARILTVMFGGMLSALVLAIIGDAIPLERRASAMGKVMAGFSLAAVVGVPLGNYLASAYSWHMPFYTIRFMGLMVCLMIWLYVPSMNSHIAHPGKTGTAFHFILSILKNNSQRQALLLMTLLMLGQFTVIPFIAPYMIANVGFSQHDITYIYLIGGLFTVVSSPVAGKLADKFGRSKIFTIFVLLSLIPLFGITHLPKVAIPLALTVTSLFFICVSGRMIPATTMITSTVHPQNRGGFMSIHSSVQQLSAGMATFISGGIINKAPGGLLLNYHYVGYIAIAASLLSILVARKIKAVDLNTEAQK